LAGVFAALSTLIPISRPPPHCRHREPIIQRLDRNDIGMPAGQSQVDGIGYFNGNGTSEILLREPAALSRSSM
jgi:hypothetical protein